MNLSEITATLRNIHVSPVKTLGQNFLHDQNLVRWIIKQAELKADDYVVEIGPGLGALTAAALRSGARVLVIEKDGRLAKYLSARFSGEPLEVLHKDALCFDVRTLFAHTRVKLLANLPYYLSSQLLFKFLTYPTPITLALLTLQKEMARRLSSGPSSKDYGALTLLIQFHYRVEYLRTIAADVFYPRPDVESAAVKFSPRDKTELPACDQELFARLIRRGFSQRRKQVGKLLREEIPDWPRAAHTLGFEPSVRAEALSLNQWINLTNYLQPIRRSPHCLEANEKFAVVDERDRVIGAASRGQVHGDNLRHRAVHIFIFSKTGDVLLQRRSRWKDRHPLLWDSSAAGHAAAGESYDRAAKRELEEELGVQVELEKVLKLPASEETGQEFIWLYAGRHEGKLTPNLAEIDAVLYFPLETVRKWTAARPGEFAPAFLQCWQAYEAKVSAGSEWSDDV